MIVHLTVSVSLTAIIISSFCHDDMEILNRSSIEDQSSFMSVFIF